MVVGDEYSIYQTVINLADNAIKYSSDGYVELRVLRNGEDNLQIEVEDTGMGMSQEYVNHMFDAFSQEETGYTRRFEGTGLGLSLVKKYCDLNGIDISVASEKDEGTKFTLTFRKGS
jgi:signal transduction histidine kinase